MKIFFYIEAKKSLGHLTRTIEIIKEIKKETWIYDIFVVINCKFINPLIDLNINFKQINIEDIGSNGGEVSNILVKELDFIIKKENPDALIFDTFFSKQILTKYFLKKKILILREMKINEKKKFLENKYYELFDLILYLDIKNKLPMNFKNLNNIKNINPIVKKQEINNIKLKKKLILATCGGGGFTKSSIPFIKTCIKLFNKIKNNNNFLFILITGPYFKYYKKIKKYETNNFKILKFYKNILSLFNKSEFVITESGYNTINELINLKKSMILMPGFRNNDDQFKRANYLKEKGIAQVINNYDLKEILDSIKYTLKNKTKIKQNFNSFQLKNGIKNAKDEIIKEINPKKYFLKLDNNCNNNCIFCNDLNIKNNYSIIPKRISIIYSNRCNLKCKQCNLWKKSEEELSLNEIKEIIIQLKKEFNTKKIVLSGKEPFMRDDIFELIEFGEKLNIFLIIVTNGTLINKKKQEKLKKYNNYHLIISLDGFEKTHEKIRGVKNIYTKIIDLLNFLKKEKKSFSITTIILKSNLKELVNLVTFAKNYKTNITFHIYYCNFGTKYNDEWYKNKKEWPGKIDNYINQLIEIKKKQFPIFNSIEQLELFKKYYSNPKKKILNNCNASKNQLTFYPKQKINSCFEKTININNKDYLNYTKIWNSKEYNNKRIEDKKCKLNCNLLNCYYNRKLKKDTNELINYINLLKQNYTEIIFPCNFDTRDDFFEILKYSKKEEFKTTLNTNARIFNCNEFTINASKYINKYEIFLHGPKDIHDKITKIKGSFNQTIKGIKNIKKQTNNIIINIIILKENYKYLKEIIDECLKLNIKIIKITFPIKKENKYIPKIDEFQKEYDKLLNYIKNKEIYIKINKNLYNPYIDNNLNLDYNLAKLVFKNKINKNVIDWRITNNCNYNCSYCIRPIKKKEKYKLIKNKKIKKITQNLNTLKEKWEITISGGEPFTIKNLDELIKSIITNTKHSIYIVTNLSHPIDYIINILKIIPKNRIGITVSYHPENVKINEFIKKAIKLNKFLLKKNSEIIINLVATKENLKLKNEIKKIINNNLKINLLGDKRFINIKKHYNQKEIELINKFRRDFEIKDKYFKGLKCNAGKKYMVINEEGEIFRCGSAKKKLKEILGNIFKNNLKLNDNSKICNYNHCDCIIPYQNNLIEDINTIKFSIIIPTYNRKKYLKIVLKNILKIDYPKYKFEVIIIDDGSDDNTKEEVQKLNLNINLKYYYWSKKNNINEYLNKKISRRGSARNIGIKNAKGEILLFLDSDMIPDTNLLKEHEKIHKKNDRCIIIGNRINLKKDLNIFKNKNHLDLKDEQNERLKKYVEKTNGNFKKLKFPWLISVTNNLSIKKKNLSGFFDHNFIFWGFEDIEFGYRCFKNNLTFIYNKNAIGYHIYHKPDFSNKKISLKMKIGSEIFYKLHLDNEIYESLKKILI